MSFTLLACLDIRGEKVNIELPFVEKPGSLPNLIATLTSIFRGEEAAIATAIGEASYPRPPSEPLVISRVQRYRDDTQDWTELTLVDQLQPYDQLYVFRKNATKSDISTQRELPRPRRSTFFPAGATATPSNVTRSESNPGGINQSWSSAQPNQASYSQPRNGASGVEMKDPSRGAMFLEPAATHNAGTLSLGGSSGLPGSQVASHLEQVQFLFHTADPGRRGFLNLRDFQSIFRTSAIQFPPDTIEEVHQVYARERRGEPVMSFENFETFGSDYPTTISVAYARLHGDYREQELNKQKREVLIAIDDLQRQKQQLEDRMRALQGYIKNETDRRDRIQSEIEEIRVARDPTLYEQEQRLLDKESSVQIYRRRLANEEQDFQRLAAARRRSAAAQTDRAQYHDGD